MKVLVYTGRWNRIHGLCQIILSLSGIKGTVKIERWTQNILWSVIQEEKYGIRNSILEEIYIIS